MTAPLFITTEKRSSTLPILLVDKPGTLSKGLVSLLSEHFSTVFLSENHTLSHLTRVRHIPYRRSVPAVPDDYFAGIIIFYFGEKGITDGMKSFLTKAKQNNTKVLLITSRELASTPVLQKALADYEHAHLIVYGDIFGVSSDEESVVTRMLAQAAHRGQITVHGSGLTESAPVYYADLMQAILHVLLSHRPPKIGLAFPRHTTPEIHLARLIQTLYPGAEVDCVGKETKHTPPQVLDGETLIENPYPLSEKLQQLKKTPGVPITKTHARKHRSWPALKRWPLFLSLLLTGVVLLLFSTLLFFVIGLLNLQVAVQAGKRDDLSLVVKRSQTAALMFRTAERSAAPLQLVGSLVGLHEPLASYTAGIRAGKTAAGVAGYLADAGIRYQALAKNENKGGGEEMVAITADVKHALLGIDRLKAEEAIPASYLKELTVYQGPLQKLSGVIDSLAYLSGSRKEQVYLVLFQNNMELRPGGGFIGSYGLLTIKNGTINSFAINDVYNADGQLTGHVEPPFALRRYLGAAHWYLRDSNFDVEFTRNAGQAAVFLNLSTGQKVDGVIAMDISFLRTLLEKTGPVYVPSLNKTVTAKNFYLLAQAQAETDFFPGSTKKKDFLEHVAQSLILSLQEREQLPLGALLLAADEALKQKHLMFASANPSLTEVFIANNLAPSIRKTEAEKHATIADISGVIEANLGANKANFYVKRQLTEQVSIDERGGRKGSLTIVYHNTSQKNSQFGGGYKNYLRLLLREDASLDQITIDQKEQDLIPAVTSARVFTAPRFVPPQGFEVEKEITSGRSLFGFLVEVPAGQTKTVTVSYSIPAPAPLPESFTYVHRTYKQPGTEHDPYQLVVQSDPTLRILRAPAFAGRVGNTLQVVRDLSEDITLTAEFVRTQ
jgi:hypothetical protein